MTDHASIISKIYCHKEGFPDAHWILFENDTVAVGDKSSMSFDEFQIKALANIQVYDDMYVGGELGDFAPIRMDAVYPDEPVWMVEFTHFDGAVLYYGLIADAGDEGEFSIGMQARSNRDLDASERSIKATSRDFNQAV